MKKFAYLFVIAAGIMTAGCSSLSGEPDDPTFVICPSGTADIVWTGPQPLSEVASANVDKANGFASSLFKSVYDKEGGNICVSPASVFATFAMMANGDSGQTRDEILHMLGYDSGPGALHDLNVFCNALMTEMSILNGATQCAFSNSIWHHPDVTLLPEFSTNMKLIYDASIFPVWIGDEDGRLSINEYVERQTCGMIKDFLTCPLDVRLAFLNTLYFKGAWKKEFDSALTGKGVFHNLDGSESEVQFMLAHDVMSYGESEGLRAVTLPYAGERYTMTVVQPSQSGDFSSLLESLDTETIERLADSSKPREILLKMPKFESGINVDLVESLESMGFNRVFFPGIDRASTDPLYLTQFIHAVKIIVDENGTEAAAVSLAGMDNCASPGSEPLPVFFDHPSVYVIRDTASGAILFMGAITSF